MITIQNGKLSEVKENKSGKIEYRSQLVRNTNDTDLLIIRE